MAPSSTMGAVALVLFGGVTTADAGPPQRSDVYAPFDCDFGATIDCIDVGNAELTRNKNGVAASVQTSGLIGGSVYTLWWVVFNNPGGCVGDCGGDDLGIPGVNATVIWATGNVTGGSGMSGFGAHLKEGDTSNVEPFGLPGDGDGLIDAMTAEIHLVVRTHGPALPGQVRAQMSEFNGGCGPNTCDDVQFSVFLAP